MTSGYFLTIPKTPGSSFCGNRKQHQHASHHYTLSAFMLTSIIYTVDLPEKLLNYPKVKTGMTLSQQANSRNDRRPLLNKSSTKRWGPAENGGKTTVPQESLPCGLRDSSATFSTPPTSTATQLPLAMLLPPLPQPLSFKSALYSWQAVFLQHH